MGREALITYEQVAAAADAAVAGGARPTSRGIRERLGNAGSMGTINKMLQRWKSSQSVEIVAPMSLPRDVQKVLLEFMGQELTRARAELEADVLAYQHESAELAAENERQFVSIEHHVAEGARIAREKATAEGRVEQLLLELNAAKSELAREREAIELARTELAKSQLRQEQVPRLQREIAALQEAIDKARASHADIERVAAVLEVRNTGLEEKSANLQSMMDKIETDLKKQAERLVAAEAEFRAEHDARLHAEHAVAMLSGKRIAPKPSVQFKHRPMKEQQAAGKNGPDVKN